MSHRIRKEKICLNCGTETLGHYCPSCGQKNIEPKQSLWHILSHTFSDITHWDGKFFTTVKDLFAKPGFLSREYMIGRRMRYLDPIRMYIFTSAIFFLIFFSMFDVKNMDVGEKTRSEISSAPDVLDILAKVKSTQDSLKALRNYNALHAPKIKTGKDSSTGKQDGRIHFGVQKNNDYHTIAEYDSVQKSLPVAKRDGWFKRKINYREIVLNQRFEKEPGTLFKELIGNFLHNSPKMLFISLPIFALLLKLLYIRRKQFYYVDHGIFAVHLYIFSFLMLLVLFGLNELISYTNWVLLKILMGILFLYPFFYYYKAMRKFYEQRRAKTILKYFVLLFLSLFVQVFIFVCAFAFSVFEV